MSVVCGIQNFSTGSRRAGLAAPVGQTGLNQISVQTLSAPYAIQFFLRCHARIASPFLFAFLCSAFCTLCASSCASDSASTVLCSEERQQDIKSWILTRAQLKGHRSRAPVRGPRQILVLGERAVWCKRESHGGRVDEGLLGHFSVSPPINRRAYRVSPSTVRHTQTPYIPLLSLLGSLCFSGPTTNAIEEANEGMRCLAGTCAQLMLLHAKPALGSTPLCCTVVPAYLHCKRSISNASRRAPRLTRVRSCARMVQG